MTDRAGKNLRIDSAAASEWWRSCSPAGALLNRLMLLFIAAPIALVFQDYYVLSFVVFLLMIPYGLWMRYLAVRAAEKHLSLHPEEMDEFRSKGIARTRNDVIHQGEE